MLSVFVITRNEEHDIEACLTSVAGLADEIVVVDSGSTDRTLELVRRFTDRIFTRPWTGYSAQKQFALEQCRGDWALNIDADERVSPALREEIRAVMTRPAASCNGYYLHFRHFFLGKLLKFGAGRGETHLRLFRKAVAAYGTSPVHEGIRVEPPLGRMRGAIDHFSYKDVDEYLTKCNFYTRLIAEEKFKEGARFRWWHHLRLPYEFVVRYLVQGGFLDGSLGLTYAVLSSYYVWLKFVKLRDLEAVRK